MKDINTIITWMKEMISPDEYDEDNEADACECCGASYADLVISKEEAKIIIEYYEKTEGLNR